MKVCVIGMGKIGLPLAVQFALKGQEVIGADINGNTVDSINNGITPFPGELGLDEKLKQVVGEGKFIAKTSNVEGVKDADVVVVVVPLFVDKNGEADFSALDSVCEDIADSLKMGALVSFETTLPVGTTRNRLGEIIHRRSGLVPGRDFALVFSPERVLTGRVFSDLRKYPKIVGGVSNDCTKRGEEFYSSVLEFDQRPDLGRPNGVWCVENSETAELIKLAETTYRDVNIALTNQFAKFADRNQLDYSQVIEACNSQPYSHLHTPGIAVGGHCIPVYPQLYLLGDPEADLVSTGRKINSGMPKYAISRIVDEFGDLNNVEVLVLGASYRAGVKEVAYSGAYKLVEELNALGAVTQVYDPIFSPQELTESGFMPASLGKIDHKIIIIQNEDPSFIDICENALLGTKVKLIYDGRNILNDSFKRDDVRVIGLGR
jgi:nucleotide sugar dehydrogenase